jgi:hypothetical protein
MRHSSKWRRWQSRGSLATKLLCLRALAVHQEQLSCSLAIREEGRLRWRRRCVTADDDLVIISSVENEAAD